MGLEDAADVRSKLFGQLVLAGAGQNTEHIIEKSQMLKHLAALVELFELGLDNGPLQASLIRLRL